VSGDDYIREFRKAADDFVSAQIAFRRFKHYLWNTRRAAQPTR
jgi:hypothetical protein